MLYRVVAEIKGERVERRIFQAPYEPGATKPAHPFHVYAAMKATLVEEGYDADDLEVAAYSLIE